MSSIFRIVLGHRILASGLAVTLAVQLTGCGSAPFKPDHEPAPQDAATVVMASASAGALPVRVSPGWVSLQVEPSWSMHRRDPVLLTIDALPKKELLVFAHESGRGLVPATLALAPAPPRPRPSLKTELLHGVAHGLAPLIVVTAPIWLSIYALTRHTEVKNEPSDPCCFVWIEDAVSGEVVAGRSPWGQLSVRERRYAQGEASAAARIEGEDLVNCAVVGKRNWVYRSQCD
jgi:hypothetical protein